MIKKILLLTSMVLAITISAQDCSELFFSEYVEGSLQNKAIEVYNPTNGTIDLSSYSIERYRNGNTNSSDGGITNLVGVLLSGDVFVVTSGETDMNDPNGYCDPALIALGDLAEPSGSYPTPLHMNGNDAMVLTKNGEVIDVIGKVGEDPSSGAWTDDAASGFQEGAWWTINHTLIRKKTILTGDNDGLDLFNPSLEWDSLPNHTWDKLGTHTCNCTSTSAVNGIKKVSYVVYPTPASAGEIITVNTTANIEKIDVINTLGEKVLTEKSNNINTSSLSKGNYIILIKLDDNQVLENKIIIE